MPHEIMEQFIHQLVIDPPQPCYHDAKVDKLASGTFFLLQDGPAVAHS